MFIDSVMYNRVLDTGNFFTKGWVEDVVRRFKEDEDFRSSVKWVQTLDSDRMELQWPYVALELKELYLTTDCLMADAEVLDTPQGRIIDRFLESGSKFFLAPRLMWKPLRIDGINIISADSYSYLFFVMKEMRSSPQDLCILSGELAKVSKMP